MRSTFVYLVERLRLTHPCGRALSACVLKPTIQNQVTRLVEENRGLKHRLAKYEASPQQARYKYARQSAPPHAHSAGPRETSSSSSTASGGRRNGSTKRGPAAGPPAGRNEGSGGAAAAFEGRNGGRGGSNCGKPVSCVNSRESAALADRVLHF